MGETAPAANLYREHLDRLLSQPTARLIPPPSEAESKRERERRACEAGTRRGLPPEHWGDTFGSFDLAVTPGMKTALNAVKRLISMSPGFPQLMLVGPYGIGKTHLAYAACNHCRERGWPYRFVRAVELMRELRRAISRDDISPEELIGAYAGNFLLVVDDWGAQQKTAYAEASMYDLLDDRYRLGRPTIITTNCDPEQLDPRIASRFAAGIIACEGADQRVRFDR